ncbi:hypothetical protein AURDEDRAFT_117351, partial [Auricularia subglabra TFB-10046 SS5]
MYADHDGSHRSLSRLLKRVAPTLRRLHLGVYFGRYDAAFITVFAGALLLAPRLHTLSLQTRNGPVACYLSLFEALPRTLCTLALGQTFLPPHTIARDGSWDNSLNDAQDVLERVKQGALPALRDLTMGADGQTTHLVDKETEPARNPSFTMFNKRRQEELVKDAAKLGVTLNMLDKELPDQLPWFYM